MFISNIMKIFEEKLKTTKLFIEPCLSQIREDLLKKENKNNNKENNIKFDKILAIAKENINNNNDNIKKIIENEVYCSKIFNQSQRNIDNDKMIISPKINKNNKQKNNNNI